MTMTQVARETTRPTEPEAHRAERLAPSMCRSTQQRKQRMLCMLEAASANHCVFSWRDTPGGQWAYFLHCYKRLIVSSCLTVCSIGHLRAIRIYCAA